VSSRRWRRSWWERGRRGRGEVEEQERRGEGAPPSLGGCGSQCAAHLARRKVVEEDREGLGLLAVVLDDDARAADDLAGDALLVELAEAGPLAEELGVRDLRARVPSESALERETRSTEGEGERGTHLDEVDLVLGAQGLDELDVLALGARLVEDAEVGLALVEGLGALAEAAGEAVVDEGLLEDLLEGVLDRHLALGGLGLLDLDLLDVGHNLGLASVVAHDLRARRGGCSVSEKLLAR